MVYICRRLPPCIKSVLHMQHAAVKYTTLTFRKSCKTKVVGHGRARRVWVLGCAIRHISITDNSRHFTVRTTSVLAVEFTSAPSVGVMKLAGNSILLPRQLRHRASKFAVALSILLTAFSANNHPYTDTLY